MKKRLRWIIGIVLGILLCCAVFYALCMVEKILTPEKVCATLQEAIGADKDFADYIEIMAQSEVEGYTFVAAKVSGKEEGVHIQAGVFQKTDEGWISPAKGILPVSDKVADVGDSFCFIDMYRIVGTNGYCINIDLPEASDIVPSFADSMGSDFETYSYQSVPSIGYSAWAILPELPDGYTVYVNQEPVVIK